VAIESKLAQNNSKPTVKPSAYRCIPKNLALHTSDIPKTRRHNSNREAYEHDPTTQLEITPNSGRSSPARHSPSLGNQYHSILCD
jgi:hypothetical protein